jgi:hypothetical protein
MITANFSHAEMACRCGCGFAPTGDDDFMKKLQRLRERVGPLPVNSGSRCETHNKKKVAILDPRIFNRRAQIFKSLDLAPFS